MSGGTDQRETGGSARARSPSNARPTSYRRIVGDREMIGLLGAAFVSTAGDQLARLALGVLVYRRTGSTVLAAASFAATYLPALLGASMLAGLADRLPRRRVMLAADVLRAALVAPLAVPGLPLAAAFLLIVAVTVVESPFDACRSALLPDVAGDGYTRALALDRAGYQGAQVVGYATGGAIVVLVGATGALLLDAGTFLFSAALLLAFVRPRPPAEPDGSVERAGRLRDALVGWQMVLSDPAIRRIVFLAWGLAAVAIVPEGLAVPYAADLHGGAVAAGLLLAANPVGNVAAAFATARISARRRRHTLALSLAVTVPLAICALHPPLAVVVALVAASGAGMSVNLLIRAQFVETVPGPARGRAFAVAGTGVTVGQGLSVAAAGALASVTGPAVAIAIAGSIGTGCVMVLAAGPAMVRS